jgi:hypothetical protein
MPDCVQALRVTTVSCDSQLPTSGGGTHEKKSNHEKAKSTGKQAGVPDLEHVKSAVLVSLRSAESQRSYRRSIDDFVCWYCSEPRLSFNKTVVTRYRNHLEQRFLAPGTINVRLAALRRLAYEAADNRLLSPDLAARSKEARHEVWQLADGRGSAFPVAASQQAHRKRQKSDLRER